MKERLRLIRSILGFSQQEMADNLDCNIRAYRSYEYETRSIPIELLYKLHKNLNINLNWLISGDEKIFQTKCNNTLLKQFNTLSTKNLNTFHKRFNEIQQSNMLNDREFAAILGTNISRIEKFGIGKAFPTIEELNRIKENFDVSVDWLLYGENSDKKPPKKQTEKSLSNEEIAVLKKLAKKLNI